MNKQKRKSNDAVCIPPLDTRAVNKTEVFLESVYVCNIPSAMCICAHVEFLKKKNIKNYFIIIISEWVWSQFDLTHTPSNSAQ